MAANLLHVVESKELDAETILAKAARIHARVLEQSKYLGTPNFTRIHPSDLALLFADYDGEFFDGRIKEMLGTTPLRFGLSNRMTRSGGKTVSYRDRADPNRWRFEITVSATLLFACFAGDDHRPIACSGITCRDRLDALQRVMEHELTHLVEMLLWERSSCSKPRFHSITRRLFGHTKNQHKLITPRERAFAKFGIRPGSRVRFRFDGAEHTGIVNRVNKRATVLVEDSRGAPYCDGKHYAKFYVPVQMLEVIDGAPTDA